MAEQNFFFIQAPTGGWNARDPLVAMPPEDAYSILNVFPDTDTCRLKGGTIEAADVGSARVHTLGVLADTTSEKLFCVSGTNGVYDVTAGGAGTNINPGPVITVTDDVPYQFTTFKNILVAVNGTDSGFTWGGTGNIVGATWTGVASTALINVSSYKSRLYFVQKATTKMWYPVAVDQDPTTAIPLVSFDFQYVFSKGGTLIFTGSTTKQTGYVDQELFVAISSQGEVVVYQGDYPGAASWGIIARFFIAKPLPYRSGFYVGSDLHLITWQGIVPMSELLANIDVNNQYLTVSGKIAREFSTAAAQTIASTAKYWMGIYAPKYRYVLINIIFDSLYQQFVMNNITKAWTKFNDTAYSWAVWNDDIYFGGESGKVYKADQQSGADSFNLMGLPNMNKKVNFIQPLVGALYTPPTLNISQQIIPDFNFNAETATITLACDNTEVINRNVYHATAFGKFIGLKYSGAQPNNTQLRFFGTWLTYERGGFIP
jgi:hypothetical protein